ncbi:MAG: hypothetical protein WCD70_14355 [Alphaproteobacteria bacterium]
MPRRKRVVLRAAIHAPGRDALVPQAAQMLGVEVGGEVISKIST